MGARLTDAEATLLVRRAAAGDAQSWAMLVDAYAGLITTIARTLRLNDSDVADVSQTTWLRLVEHLDDIDDPARVGAWLATTARRESLRVIGRSVRSVPVADLEALLDGQGHDDGGVDAELLDAERDAEVRRALHGLPVRCRQLLELLMLEPAPSYEEISAAMGMPVGSIGPTRGRCLKRLEALLAPATERPRVVALPRRGD